MKKKIVFIGNSIVNGFPHKRSACFASLVREKTKDEVINKGENGDVTSNILMRFEKDVISHHPDYVFVMSGTNDFIYKDTGFDKCLENLKKLAAAAKEAGIYPVIMTPVPVNAGMAHRLWMAGSGVDYIMVEEQLKKLSAALCEYCMAENTGLIDVNTGYRAFAESVGRFEAYIDGIHPTAEGHIFIAGLICDWLCENASEEKAGN
ncbi:MAG: hypothetical protein K6F52_05085 [Clostridia bacterium]|nr:hypothetical protein [Clostridia bacterium]